mgnify:CR=1 FL=1
MVHPQIQNFEHGFICREGPSIFQYFALLENSLPEPYLRARPPIPMHERDQQPTHFPMDIPCVCPPLLPFSIQLWSVSVFPPMTSQLTLGAMVHASLNDEKI